jgi:hypothetical protein
MTMASNRSVAIAAFLGACVLGGLTFAGCGGVAEVPVGTERERDEPEVPAVTLERTAKGRPCMENEALAVFGATDGWTFSHTFAVCESGRVELDFSTRGPAGPPKEGRVAYELAARDVRRLQAALAQARLASLERRDQGSSHDLVTFFIRSEGRTLSVDEVAVDEGRVPERLAQLVAVFRSILDPAVADAELRIPVDPRETRRFKTDFALSVVEDCGLDPDLSVSQRRAMRRVEVILRGGLGPAEERELDAILNGELASC